MNDLGPDEQKWLDVLRSGNEPTSNDRARIRASVLASIAGGAVGAGTAAAASSAAPGVAKVGAVATVAAPTSFFAGTLKLGLAIVVLAVGGGGAFVAMKRPTAAITAAAPATPTEQEVMTASPPADVPSGDLVVQAPAVDVPPVAETTDRSPTVGSTRSTPRRTTTTQKSADADDIDAQLVLITQAQRALERGEPNAALAALARHEREYPRGSLAPEREGLRAIASCDAKRSNGRALAERFVAANPSSPLVARIRKSCLSQ